MKYSRENSFMQNIINAYYASQTRIILRAGALLCIQTKSQTQLNTAVFQLTLSYKKIWIRGATLCALSRMWMRPCVSATARFPNKLCLKFVLNSDKDRLYELLWMPDNALRRQILYSHKYRFIGFELRIPTLF